MKRGFYAVCRRRNGERCSIRLGKLEELLPLHRSDAHLGWRSSVFALDTCLPINLCYLLHPSCPLLLIGGRGIDTGLDHVGGSLLSELVQSPEEAIFRSGVGFPIPFFVVPTLVSLLAQHERSQGGDLLRDQIGGRVDMERDLGVYKLLLRRSLDLVQLRKGELNRGRFLLDY